MMELKQKDKIEFLICKACRGYGTLENKVCLKCQGIGVVLPFYGKFLYWGKKIDALNIAVDHATNFVDRLFNLLLMLIGLFGLVVLGYVAFVNNFNNILSANYWLTPSWEKAVFWVTILTDLYLYYRLQQATAPRKRVMPKIYVKQPNVPAQVDWSYILKQPKRNLIDVSEAFEESTQDMVNRAWQLAREFNHAHVERVHLFGVVPQFDQGAIIWGRLGIKGDRFREKISRVLSWNLEANASITDMSPELYKILLYAYIEAYDNNEIKVQVPEVVLGLSNINILNTDEKAEDYVERILIDLDLNYQKIQNVVAWIKVQSRLRAGLQHFRARARYRSKSGMDKAMTAIATPFLDRVSTDLTLSAKYGQLFPCIGRDDEFESIYRVIEGSRSGVLLVGNIGVGRTTIIEGLAQRMVEESVPEPLKDKRLVSISVSKLISGATPAEAEERLIILASEVSRARNIVLIIEELHGLTGITSGGSSSMDLAAVLAEVMRKAGFLVIATTTPNEYTQAIEGGVLDSAFQTVKVEELEINDAIQVLEAKSGPIEYKNNVFFSYDSIEKAAQLSIKYIHDRYLPDKALDIMEEVAVKVRKERGDRAIIEGEDVAKIISGKTGVLTTKITEKESEKLLHLEDEIHGRIVGQDEAVKFVASSLRRARAELRDTKRPIANLMFLGPTGVGKTELAKTVAEVYFGKEENMLRFDMSEYQDKASIARIIGTRDRAGIVTEAVRKRPFSLLLFDEVEKSHPDILNLFLQVMDDGRLTDGQGRTVDFTNTIIIMTSNAGAQVIQDEINKGTSIDQIKEQLINEELKQYFRPEFLNRFDGVVVFKPLTMTEVIQVARLLTEKVIERLQEKNITLQVTDEAVAELAEKGYDPKFGARPLRRVIQDQVDNTLADYLLKGEITKRDVVVLEPSGKLRIEKAEQI